ncbi:hypothetical protein [Epilithonimonas zeae]|nr:hypothetical protein [Epilithonimonas zeae]UQB69545.1 hypothetical protein KI430_03720 [Epilithonimonas zeae]
MITKSPFCQDLPLAKSATAEQSNLNITSQTVFGIFSGINDVINFPITL